MHISMVTMNKTLVAGSTRVIYKAPIGGVYIT